MISMTPSGEDDYNDNEDENNDNETCKMERRPRQNDVRRCFTEMGMIFGNNLQLHGNYSSPITRHLNAAFDHGGQGLQTLTLFENKGHQTGNTTTERSEVM